MLRTLGRLPRFETALLVLATALLVALSVASDRRSHGVHVDSYSTYDADGGGYRAFYELLGREGVRVERFEQRPAFLGPALDTLVWVEPLPFDPTQSVMAAADIAALQTWVRDGGRLLYVGHDDA
ncbi:MAG: DUF4350 domain-containing protein, partial [Candidatus Eremiobacteraeota bacterium]|nr:DUF4350 domain-containing protein [Candidatus Eremiobacteraeota bacterium]